jgi:putative peptide zinc metalloprotease protein
VLRRFDGAGVEHVRACVERECGVRLTAEELAVFAQRACDIGLLECPGTSIIRRSRRKGLSWSVPLWNPEHAFAWCAARSSWLFHPVAVGGGVVTITVAVLALMESAQRSTRVPVPTPPQLAIFVILLNIVSILHESGHGLALHRYGGSVQEIGVRLVLGWPCWYCDITESYLLPRRWQRIAVILAGPFVQAIVCAATVLAARGANPHVVALRGAAALLGMLSVLNFFPLVQSDGYYLLTELAGMPNLRTDAWKWLTSSAARQRMRLTLPKAHRLAIATYAVASFGFVAFLLEHAVMLVARVFVGGGQLSIRTVTAAISVIVILTTLAKGRSSTA